jgi:HSP20 family protein
MTITQFDPFSRLDRMFDRLLSDGGTRHMSMPMDVYRSGDAYVVELDLPGVSPDDIDVSIERNVISVRAQRGAGHCEGDEIVVCERPHVRFERQIYVGDNLDTDELRASYDDGVLTLRVPVSRASQARHVDVVGGSRAKPVRAGGSSADAEQSEQAGMGATTPGAMTQE